MTPSRTASRSRKTAETSIELSLNIDGSGISTIDTGVPFFDHMLTLFSKHGLFDLKVKTIGDIEVDYHHTIEDTGIVIGDCLREALGTKEGIRRYGCCYLPMDETLARVVVEKPSSLRLLPLTSMKIVTPPSPLSPASTLPSPSASVYLVPRTS